MTITIIGGDLRFLYTARRLAERHHTVTLYSPDGACRHSESFSEIPLLPLEECARGAEAILLPLPASRGGGVINCPLVSAPADIGKLFSLLPRGIPVFAGKADKCITVAARDAGAELTDYFTSESLLTANALYTAEGALSMLIAQLPRAICGSDIAVFGYGRIASLLTRRLIALGARVRVIARSGTRRAMAESDGARTYTPTETADALRGVICAVNTVPAAVMDQSHLLSLSPAPLLELADTPGTDPRRAESAGVRIIPAPGLPGKFAPESAGILIADTVLSMLG